MGAHDISFTLDGNKTISDVKTYFKDQQRQDADCNGHRDGYSGDFQTVDEVDFHDSKTEIFQDANTAMEYCLEHAKKWTTVVAVKYFESSAVKRSKKSLNLEHQLKMARLKKQNLETSIVHKILDAKSATVACKGCKSKLSRNGLKKYAKHHTMYFKGHHYDGNCPLCGHDLRSATDLKRIESAKKAIKRIDDALRLSHENDAKKAKKGAVKWMIAGWGAC